MANHEKKWWITLLICLFGITGATYLWLAKTFREAPQLPKNEIKR